MRTISIEELPEVRDRIEAGKVARDIQDAFSGSPQRIQAYVGERIEAFAARLIHHRNTSGELVQGVHNGILLVAYHGRSQASLVTAWTAAWQDRIDGKPNPAILTR